MGKLFSLKRNENNQMKQVVDYRFFSTSLSEIDPLVSDVISSELQRQKDQIELIASENIVSQAILDAQGSVLTNKYAEGYPGRR